MTRKVTLWRISNYTSLDGIGGMYAAGGWHTKGHAIVYCSEDPSTALLEILVHIEIDAEDRPEFFQLLKVQSTQAVSIQQLDIRRLRIDWRSDLTHTRSIGDEWLLSGETLLLEVPSALVPERRNFLINPAHPDFRRLGIIARYHHPLTLGSFGNRELLLPEESLESSPNNDVMHRAHYVSSGTHWTSSQRVH